MKMKNPIKNKYTKTTAMSAHVALEGPVIG